MVPNDAGFTKVRLKELDFFCEKVDIFSNIEKPIKLNNVKKYDDGEFNCQFFQWTLLAQA